MTTASRPLATPYLGARFAGDLLVLHHPQGHDRSTRVQSSSSPLPSLIRTFRSKRFV